MLTSSIYSEFFVQCENCLNSSYYVSAEDFEKENQKVRRDVMFSTEFVLNPYLKCSVTVGRFDTYFFHHYCFGYLIGLPSSLNATEISAVTSGSFSQRGYTVITFVKVYREHEQINPPIETFSTASDLGSMDIGLHYYYCLLLSPVSLYCIICITILHCHFNTDVDVSTIPKHHV